MSALLTVDHKRDDFKNVWRCLNVIQMNFFLRFITVNETWIHYFTSETKKQSKQWTSLGKPEDQKKTKTVKSAGKVMATFFGMHAI